MLASSDCVLSGRVILAGSAALLLNFWHTHRVTGMSSNADQVIVITFASGLRALWVRLWISGLHPLHASTQQTLLWIPVTFNSLVRFYRRAQSYDTERFRSSDLIFSLCLCLCLCLSGLIFLLLSGFVFLSFSLAVYVAVWLPHATSPHACCNQTKCLRCNPATYYFLHCQGGMACTAISTHKGPIQKMTGESSVHIFPPFEGTQTSDHRRS